MAIDESAPLLPVVLPDRFEALGLGAAESSTIHGKLLGSFTISAPTRSAAPRCG